MGGLFTLGGDETAKRRSVENNFRGNFRGWGGFTIVELLVVIVILVALMGIILPTISMARKSAAHSASKQFLVNLSIACVAYERDHKMYPPSSGGTGAMNGWDGGEILTQALLGHMPDDGADGLGFRIGNRGRVYGPYINVVDEDLIARWDNYKDPRDEDKDKVREDAGERFIAIDINDESTDLSVTNAYMFRDKLESPILYFRAGGGGATGALNDPTPGNRIWGTGGKFDITHNPNLVQLGKRSAGYDSVNMVKDYWAQKKMDGGPSDADRQGMELSLRTSKFMLISTGFDQVFGLNNAEDNSYRNITGKYRDEYDDIIITGP